MCNLCGNPFHEEVRGIIIGGSTFPYQFWIDEPREEYQSKRGVPKRKIADGHFESDEEAVAWFKVNYPVEFAHGVEMRVFDKP